MSLGGGLLEVQFRFGESLGEICGEDVAGPFVALKIVVEEGGTEKAGLFQISKTKG